MYAVFKGEEGAKARVKEFWRVYYPILKRHDWVEQSWTRLPDEFASDADVKRAKAFVRWLRPQIPGLRIMATSMSYREEPRTALADSVDIWCPTIQEYVHFREFYRKRRRAGDDVWPYVHHYALLNRGENELRAYFWWLFVEGLDGCCYYSVGPRGQHLPRPYGVRQQSDMPWGDGCILWAQPGELWRSVRLARIGDGIEDWERLRLFQELAAHAARSALVPRRGLRQIEAFRAELRTLCGPGGRLRRGSAEFAETRRRLDTLLERLWKVTRR
jgi:hypothetical protein